MIIETQTTTLVTNIEGAESFKGTIAEEDFRFLLPILSNIYNDPETATIREMSSNARDSHVEAGNDDPVLITLPDADTKTFVIQDFGVGMSVDDIKNIYRNYGRSTKRGSNTSVGAFGLGCKSPLAIASQFTLVTVKDGKKANVLILKDPNFGLDAKIVSVVDTDEPNGVTVSIPVRNVYDFRQKAMNYYRFAERGMYLVDGVEIRSAYEGAAEVTDEDGEVVGYVHMDSSDTSFVVMGGVPYELTTTEIRNSGKRLGLEFGPYDFFANAAKYFPVEIGSVDLSPSREGLQYTPRTTQLVDKLILAAYNGVKAAAQVELDAEEDRAEVIKLYRKWERFGVKGLTWKGGKVRERITLADNAMYSTIDRKQWSSKASHGQGSIIDLNMDDQYIVTGHPYDKYKRAASYLAEYMTLHSIKTGHFIFLEDNPVLSDGWINENSNFTFLTFQEILDEVKADRKARRARDRANGLIDTTPRERTAITYRVLDVEAGTSKEVPVKEVPTGIVYFDASDLFEWKRNKDNEAYNVTRGYKPSQNFLDAVKLLGLKTLLLLPTEKKVETFLKRVPGAVNVSTLIDEVSKALRGEITDEVKSEWQAMRYDAAYRTNAKILKLIDASKIEDAAISEAAARVGGANEFLEKFNAYRKMVALFQITSTKVGTVDDNDLNGGGADQHPAARSDLFVKYPLVRNTLSAYSYNTVPEELSEHLTMYINMVHSTLVNAEKAK
jgi:hypothetical protein